MHRLCPLWGGGTTYMYIASLLGPLVHSCSLSSRREYIRKTAWVVVLTSRIASVGISEMPEGSTGVQDRLKEVPNEFI